MNPFLQGFTAELVKHAAGDVSGQAPTMIYGDPVDMVQGAMDSTQSRGNNLPGGIPSALRTQTQKKIPHPETTPTSMHGFIP